MMKSIFRVVDIIARLLIISMVLIAGCIAATGCNAKKKAARHLQKAALLDPEILVERTVFEARPKLDTSFYFYRSNDTPGVFEKTIISNGDTFDLKADITGAGFKGSIKFRPAPVPVKKTIIKDPVTAYKEADKKNPLFVILIYIGVISLFFGFFMTFPKRRNNGSNK